MRRENSRQRWDARCFQTIPKANKTLCIPAECLEKVNPIFHSCIWMDEPKTTNLQGIEIEWIILSGKKKKKERQHFVFSRSFFPPKKTKVSRKKNRNRVGWIYHTFVISSKWIQDLYFVKIHYWIYLIEDIWWGKTMMNESNKQPEPSSSRKK